VARLERRPEVEMIQPVLDWATWEHELLANRGLIE